MHSVNASTLGLIDMIYDAVPDASRWKLFLEAFVHATRSKRGTLALCGSEPAIWRTISWHGWQDDEIRLHSERYAAIDPFGRHDMHEGEIRLSTDLCPREVLLQTAAYREFYGPRGVDWGFGGVILRTEAGASAIIAMRGNDGGPYGEMEISILRPLMPHLRRAALLHGECTAMRAQLATFTGHLDKSPHPFLLTDREARVLYANAAARQAGIRKDGLAIEEGRLRLWAEKAHLAFLDAIRQITRGQGAPVHSIPAPRPSQKAPYRLFLMSIPDFGALPLGTSQPAAAVLIMDSEWALEPDPATLRDLFSLTPAEARVTGHLVAGRSVQEIACATGVSIETVRSQVRSILSKTGTGRQGELISLVLRMTPFGRL